MKQPMDLKSVEMLLFLHEIKYPEFNDIQRYNQGVGSASDLFCGSCIIPPMDNDSC